MYTLLEIVGLTATRQEQLLRAGQLTATELVGRRLHVIDALILHINAIITCDHEGAQQRAAVADAVPNEQRGPLHGLPVAIKDTAQTAGMRRTFHVCGWCFPVTTVRSPSRRGLPGSYLIPPAALWPELRADPATTERISRS